MLNSPKGLISQRRRVEKKMTFPLVFISSTLEIVSGEKKTFTANFAQSAENNADPVFIKSGIYIYIFIYLYIYIFIYLFIHLFASILAYSCTSLVPY